MSKCQRYAHNRTHLHQQNGRVVMINSADTVTMASRAYSDTTGGAAAINDIVIVDSKQRRANIVTNSRVADHNFPAKLHYVLTELEREGKAHIAGFMPHGRAFKVFKHQEFVDEVLNCWFRQTKFSSFQRQLNIYGFTRITTGPDANACYHPYFLRGQPDLTLRMQRMPVKGLGPRRSAAADDSAVPNFYTMPPLPLTHTVGPVEEKQRSVLNQSVASNLKSGAGQAMLPAGPSSALMERVLALSQQRRALLDVSSSSSSSSYSNSSARSTEWRVTAASTSATAVAAAVAAVAVAKANNKALVLQSIARRQRHELRVQLELRLLQERRGGPRLPTVLRAALVSLRNCTL